MHIGKFPSFRPHPLLRSAHAQTILASHVRGQNPPYRATRREVVLDDGDRIVLHDDRPDGWRESDRVAVLMHGLCGCHQSGYMVRIAVKLNAHGMRTFRKDLRGCGAGFDVAKGFAHAGKSDDVAPVLDYIGDLCPSSAVTLVGLSMSGNIVLKYLGECAGATPECLDSAVVVAPPIDLLHCGQNFRRGMNRLYDWSFTRNLKQLVETRRRVVPGLNDLRLRPWPKRLWDFDDQYTAPLSGFAGVEDYYTRCSAGPLLSKIQLPTFIIATSDDPVIPIEMFSKFPLSPSTSLHVTSHGGHFGFIGANGPDPDRRWLDWRVVEWVMQAEEKRKGVRPGVPHLKYRPLLVQRAGAGDARMV